jgi:hypothetical protein
MNDSNYSVNSDFNRLTEPELYPKKSRIVKYLSILGHVTSICSFTLIMVSIIKLNYIVDDIENHIINATDSLDVITDTITLTQNISLENTLMNLQKLYEITESSIIPCISKICVV